MKYIQIYTHPNTYTHVTYTYIHIHTTCNIHMYTEIYIIPDYSIHTHVLGYT